MNIEHVEVLVEDASMEAALRTLLPRILRGTSFQIYPHQGKHDLLSNLPNRLRGYARWLSDEWKIVIVIDRDSEDCHHLKSQLESIAAAAGLGTRSSRRTSRYHVVNRLAIEELEAWYFGDWEAVRAAYPRVPDKVPRNARYRDPDAILGGTWEALERVLRRAGYFRSGLRKIELAREVAEHMRPSQNRSRSFQVLHRALAEFARP